MLPDTISFLLAEDPAPTGPVVGCATCWAAKYCAVFSLAGPQPPPECPLLPQPTTKPRRRPSPLRPRQAM
ncbi:hypothetical protein FNT36_19035 [Hymenobacter setariae]|uniref:Uncharacterized protein n=1 Tax=Hymenobacter setariae TaxID=2594794 RepID=A0A558BP53_9BACT|nr:hypothetical protein [Hymenobacter setariae]TVT38296.1 hypothetical protein FNT36_19035 [Hymenobacter setariae]